MVTTKLKFRPSPSDSNNGCILYQVTYMHRSTNIQTPFQVSLSEWNAGIEHATIENNGLTRYSYLRYACECYRLAKKRIENIARRQQKSNTLCTTDTIIKEYQKRYAEITFFSHMKNIISKLQQRGQERTCETYKSTLSSFANFRNGNDLLFEEITPDLLISYEYYLKSKDLSLNTISFYMKRLRAVYNNAVETGLATNRNPFKKVYTSAERTVKRAIALEDIKLLKNTDLSKSASKSLARDMFLFSFYTRGMSFIDIYCLQKSNLKNGILAYKRKKTGQMLYIKWEKCMQEIANRYPCPDSPFLLNILRNKTGCSRKQYHNIQSLINRNLKAIGRDLLFQKPLTMYVARHSWASIANSNGIPVKVISEGMGHDSEKTTQIYLASLDTHVIDKANSKILKLL